METRYLRQLLPNRWWIPTKDGVNSVLNATRLPLRLDDEAKDLIYDIIINLAYQFNEKEAIAFEEGDEEVRRYLYELTGDSIAHMLQQLLPKDPNQSLRVALFHIAAFIASHTGLEGRRRGKPVADGGDVRLVVKRYAAPLYSYIYVGPYREGTR